MSEARQYGRVGDLRKFARVALVVSTAPLLEAGMLLLNGNKRTPPGSSTAMSLGSVSLEQPHVHELPEHEMPDVTGVT